MPKLDAIPAGDPCWIDVFTSDPDATRAFYGALFGWTVQDPGPDYGGYVNFLKDGLPVAGCMPNDGTSGAPDTWSTYLAVDDIASTVDAVVANGGHVLIPVMPVMELGSMAVVTDAAEAVIGIWQPGQFPGFGVVGEPETPAWFELHTRAYDKAVDFYRTVFHWDTQVAGDEPDFRYTTLGEGDGARAGIMDAGAFLPEGVPAHWSIYFAVADTDATLDRITELGGTVVRPAEDTPYGRLAEAADPTGVHFKLLSHA